jgi:hypothetical protein
MPRLRDPRTGRWMSLKQRVYNRLLIERAARIAGVRMTAWRPGERPVIRVPVNREVRP